MKIIFKFFSVEKDADKRVCCLLRHFLHSIDWCRTVTIDTAPLHCVGFLADAIKIQDFSSTESLKSSVFANFHGSSNGHPTQNSP